MALPGVRTAASSSGPVVGIRSFGPYTVAVDEGGEPDGGRAERRVVTAEYRALLELPLTAGRWFDPARDLRGGQTAGVVSRTLAEAHWDTPAEALGRSLEFFGRDVRIVGVVDAGQSTTPGGRPPAMVFWFASQHPFRFRQYIVDAGPDIQALVPLLRTAARAVAPEVAAFGFSTVERQVRQTFDDEVAAFRLFGALGLLAGVLTVVGVYGVVAYDLGRRRRELGVRAALGATRSTLVAESLFRSSKAIAAGVAAGALLSLLLGRAVRSLLFDVAPSDPAVLLLSSVGMLGVAFLATYVPARSAARVDPVRALESE